MTGVTRWRPAGVPHRHVHQLLPEPPRHRRVSRVARQPKDRLTRAFEEWLRDLPVATTHDAD
ncbi:MAG TPA: hypothetical protein VFC31_02775 [Candidatus Limnocylindria bacterium]|nr:hypothetical protein [Candidatus Limnocylindria bacterium]